MCETHDWYQNVEAKELARVRVSAGETGGRLLTADSTNGSWSHRRAWCRARWHQAQRAGGDRDRRATRETSQLLQGRVGSRAGAFRAPGDPGERIAPRFVEMIEAGFGLANTGRANARGMASPRWLAAFDQPAFRLRVLGDGAREYGSVMTRVGFAHRCRRS